MQRDFEAAKIDTYYKTKKDFFLGGEKRVAAISSLFSFQNAVVSELEAYLWS